MSYDKKYTEVRPWGQFTIIEETPNYVIKKIIVNPLQQLSIQFHHFRNETWTFVFGEGEVLNGDKWEVVKEYAYVYLPQGTKHSVKNTSEKWPLVFIEVQTGTVLSESDIVRISDLYHRV